MTRKNLRLLYAGISKILPSLGRNSNYITSHVLLIRTRDCEVVAISDSNPSSYIKLETKVNLKQNIRNQSQIKLFFPSVHRLDRKRNYITSHVA